jgi:aminopeptidase N
MIKTYTLGLIASLSCIFNFTFSQCPIKTLPYDVVSIPKEHNIDVERMRLEVNFKPEKGLVEGKVTHFFTPLRDKVDSIFFDGIGILIKKVTLNGREIQFKTAEAGFTFYPVKSLSWG